MARERRPFIRLFLTLVLVGLSIGSGTGAEAKESYARSMESYEIPDVALINQNGAKVKVKELLLSDKPVMIDFIYTTCTTICPVLSANFTNFQRIRGAEAAKTRLVSISVDPENDTPKAMKLYLQRYYAKEGWDFLTGSRENIDRVLKALNAYTMTKMDHYPLILIKSPSKDKWVRIYGLIGTTELMKEYEEVLK